MDNKNINKRYVEAAAKYLSNYGYEIDITSYNGLLNIVALDDDCELHFIHVIYDIAKFPRENMEHALMEQAAIDWFMKSGNDIPNSKLHLDIISFGVMSDKGIPRHHIDAYDFC